MKIQLRRDTAANWTANDPVLLHGEVGIETDTLKMKFGDGVNTWSALGYLIAAAGAGGGTGYVQINTGGSITGDAQFTYDTTTDTLRISGAISSNTISGGSIKGNWIGSPLDSSYITGYIASANAIVRFADSSNYYKHSSNRDIHYPSSQLLGWLNALYQESGTSATSDVAWSGASNFYGFSSNSKSLYADSSNIRFRFKASSSSKSGYSTISDGYGTITHGLGETPKHINVTPSGSLYNFGASCKVDAINIYVYLTAFGNRNVYWYAST